ncbi:hypothetical protein Q3A68_16785 [Mucilaginibacter sp. BT774]|nr:hypothetical protein [Mucilaginibacter sp. BT774]
MDLKLTLVPKHAEYHFGYRFIFGYLHSLIKGAQGKYAFFVLIFGKLLQ